MEQSKEQCLLELMRILAQGRVPYALIGGVAVQIHSTEPRTTLDIDIVVKSYDHVPRAALEAAGFRWQGRHAHSDSWVGPGATPVQFTDDAVLAQAIDRALVRTLGVVSIHVAVPLDLVRVKLRAVTDPTGRRSKRLVDLADAVASTEEHAEVRSGLTDVERSQIDAVR